MYTLRYAKRDIYASADSFKIQAFETAANDLCLDAINLNIGVYDEFKETKTLFGATASSSTIPASTCGTNNTDKDVWFTVQVPDSGKLTIETAQANGSTLNDTILQIFSGSCNAFTEITCDENSGEGNFSKVSVTGRAPTETLYIRLVENGSNIADYYSIFAYDNACTNKTTWNGSIWSNAAPTQNSIAIFNSNYTASSTLDMCLCKINDNATITIESGKSFNVTNDFINNGHIILNNQASFVQTDDNATIVGTGSYDVKIHTNPLTDARYTYFSSPVQSEQIHVFNSWAQMDRIYNYVGGTTQDWAISNSFDTMVPGKGYIVRPPNPVVFNTPSTGTATSFVGETTFNGAFNTGDITHTLTYNTGGSDDDNELIGNPYPSAVNTAMLFTNNTNANAFYFWTHEHAENTGTWVDDYAVYNSSGSTSGNATAPAPTYIASGQGLFAVATPGSGTSTFTFKNSYRVKDQNNQFLRNPNEVDLDKIWLNLSSTSAGINSQILVGFNAICSNGFDAQYDATRFNSGSTLSFYSTGIGVNTEKLAIQTRGLLTSTDEIIPLGFDLTDASITSLVISIDHFENLTHSDIYLKDNLLNTIHDLKLSDYTFTQTQIGDINTRFELALSRNALATNENELLNALIITNEDATHINITMQNNSTITGFKAYTILGKLVIDTKPNKDNFTIHTPNLKQGSVLFIKAQLENGQILHTKFIKY